MSLPNERALTIKQVANLLGVSRPTVRTMIKTGRLAAFNYSAQLERGVKPCWRVMPKDLEAFLDKTSTVATRERHA